MPSPFPGMDPFIEGQRWSDFQHNLIAEIRRALVIQLRPHYTATIDVREYLVRNPEETIEILHRPIPLALPVRAREAYIEVRCSETERRVAVVEVLRPENKRL